MKQQGEISQKLTYSWKEFQFIEEIIDFLDKNPRLQLVSFCMGRRNMWVAIFNGQANETNETNETNEASHKEKRKKEQITPVVKHIYAHKEYTIA